MSKKDTDDAVPDVPKCSGSTNGVAQNNPNGVDSPAPQHARDSHPFVSDPQLALPNSHQTPHRLSTNPVTSLTSSRPAPPSPAASRRTSGLSRTSSRPVSGMSSATSSRPASGVHHSRSVSGAESRPTFVALQPITPITTTAATPVPTTPSPNRTLHDRHPSLAPTTPASEPEPDPAPAPAPAEPTPTTTTATAVASPTAAPTLIQIRDYGFASSDPRFTGQGPHVPRANRPAILARRLARSTSAPTPSEGDEDDDDDDDYETDDEEGEGDGEGEAEGEGEKMNVDAAQTTWENVVDDGTNGWSGFRWGLGRAWGFGRMSGTAGPSSRASTGSGFPSRGDLDRNFGGEDPCGYEYEEVEMALDDGRESESEPVWDEGECEMDTECELPLYPGLYRALYAFEPEGTAEMKLDEDQLVRVIGRGGGVGWAVVVKDGLKDMGAHALVPESYLEPVRLDGEEDDT